MEKIWRNSNLNKKANVFPVCLTKKTYLDDLVIIIELSFSSNAKIKELGLQALLLSYFI